MELKVLQDERRRTFALISSSHVLLFRQNAETGKTAIELVAKEEFKGAEYQRIYPRKINGFLGLIEISGDVFLCVITNSTKCASPLQGEVVHKIQSVEFYSLTNPIWDFVELNSNGFANIDTDQNQDSNYVPRIPQHPCWELKKLLSDSSFFYSTDFDLTSTLQGRGVGTGTGMSNDSFHMDFMWNAFMMEGIINFKNNLDDRQKRILDSDHFLTTVIRGFAESSDTMLGNKRARMTIISKQSWKRAGTRFNVRGADDDGNVANFVETETILNDGRQVFSFVQIRGSISVFWEQDTALISPKVTITGSFEASHPTFEKHFDHLRDKYSLIHCVNLLTDGKSSELALTKTYVEHLKEYKKSHADSVFYTHFDFHQETKNTYADAVRVIPKLHGSLKNFDFFLFDMESNRVILEQKGTFRTNCLDCLDRTNVMQQVISLAVLREYMESLGIRAFNSLEDKHRSLWANHGDQISQIYTGTNALKSSFSRSGKMGFAGALSDATKSISRIYINNFVDKGKQQVTDTLLGKVSTQKQVMIFDPIMDYINNKLPQYESKFTETEKITILAGTFNLAGTNKSDDLTEWLFPRKGFSPSVFVVGFQEVVELNASNILKNDGSAGDYWKKQVQNTIAKNSDENYVLLRYEYMSSILIMLLVKESLVSKVTQVEGKSKKTGLGGMTANKGSAVIRLNIGSTSLCFVCSHLASGTSNADERNSDFISCYNGIRFSRNRMIKDHDYIIWMGDLNYRISSENATVRSKVKSGNFDELLKLDQLSHQRRRIPEFKMFKELQIDFPPTYKFDKFSDEYDSSEKQRVPSWTDRILYAGKDGLTAHVYDIGYNIRISDHRPVYKVFTSMVNIVDEPLKEKYIDRILQDYKSSNKEQNSLIELNDGAGEPGADLTSVSSMSTTNSNSASPIPKYSSPRPPRITTKNLMDFDENKLAPDLPSRRVPPSFNADQVQNMLMPGLTPSNVQQSISSANHSPLGLSTTKQSSSNYNVMIPTKSHSSSPTLGNTPPPPPPRRGTSNVSNSQQNIPNSIGNDSSSVPPPLPPSRNTVERSVTEPQDPVEPKVTEKVAPMIPQKPKQLNERFLAPEKISATATSSWSVMTPTKKL